MGYISHMKKNIIRLGATRKKVIEIWNELQINLYAEIYWVFKTIKNKYIQEKKQ